MRAWRAVIVAVGVAAVLAGSAATATAGPATVRPMGIGYANTVTGATTIRSAASSSTFYVGTARPGDNLADICWINGADSGSWDLVLERTGASGDHYGNTVGYVPETDLWDAGQNQHIPCPISNTSSVFNNTTMRSASYADSYAVGTAIPSDRLSVYCVITDGNGANWDLTVQQAGRGGDHLPYAASMIPANAVGGSGGTIPPCGQN